jgi:hypothetical protein
MTRSCEIWSIFLDLLLRAFDPHTQKHFSDRIERLKTEPNKNLIVNLGTQMLYCACIENIQVYKEDFIREVNCALASPRTKEYEQRLADVVQLVDFGSELQSVVWQAHERIEEKVEDKQGQLTDAEERMADLDGSVGCIGSLASQKSAEHQKHKQIDRAERNYSSALLDLIYLIDAQTRDGKDGGK